MNNFRKAISLILAAVLMIALSPGPARAQAGFSNFAYSGDYVQGQFSDVSPSHWFARYVEDAYNFGLMSGRSAALFDHGGLLTAGEAVTLAARLRRVYHTGSSEFAATVPYYQAYVDYAMLHGITDGRDDFDAPVTRARFAEFLYKALPREAFAEINPIPDYAINDVVPGAGHGAAVYALYRAGILAGSDSYGTFYPSQNLTRAEACAMMTRIVDPNLRLTTKLPDSLPAEAIYRRSVDAVISIETFDSAGRSIRTGSGFFINSAGHIITALHVIDNAASAVVTLLGGDEYDVRGILAMSEEYNIVLLSIDAGDSGFSFLNIADSDIIETGNTVYSLGNPLSYANTISDGIIAHTRRVLDDETFIMFTAPISFGSGGGPVLNTRGQVVGIASSSFTWGQNLNLAIPINYFKTMTAGEPVTLSERLEMLNS